MKRKIFNHTKSSNRNFCFSMLEYNTITNMKILILISKSPKNTSYYTIKYYLYKIDDIQC